MPKPFPSEQNQLELIGVLTYVMMEHSKMMTSSGTKTSKQVSYYVDSPSGEMTRDESFDIANEVCQSFAVEDPGYPILILIKEIHPFFIDIDLVFFIDFFNRGSKITFSSKILIFLLISILIFNIDLGRDFL